MRGKKPFKFSVLMVCSSCVLNFKLINKPNFRVSINLIPVSK